MKSAGNIQEQAHAYTGEALTVTAADALGHGVVFFPGSRPEISGSYRGEPAEIPACISHWPQELTFGCTVETTALVLALELPT